MAQVVVASIPAASHSTALATLSLPFDDSSTRPSEQQAEEQCTMSSGFADLLDIQPSPERLAREEADLDAAFTGWTAPREVSPDGVDELPDYDDIQGEERDDPPSEENIPAILGLLYRRPETIPSSPSKAQELAYLVAKASKNNHGGRTPTMRIPTTAYDPENKGIPLPIEKEKERPPPGHLLPSTSQLPTPAADENISMTTPPKASQQKRKQPYSSSDHLARTIYLDVKRRDPTEPLVSSGNPKGKERERERPWAQPKPSMKHPGKHSGRPELESRRKDGDRHAASTSRKAETKRVEQSTSPTMGISENRWRPPQIARGNLCLSSPPQRIRVTVKALQLSRIDFNPADRQKESSSLSITLELRTSSSPSPTTIHKSRTNPPLTTFNLITPPPPSTEEDCSILVPDHALNFDVPFTPSEHLHNLDSLFDLTLIVHLHFGFECKIEVVKESRFVDAFVEPSFSTRGLITYYEGKSGLLVEVNRIEEPRVKGRDRVLDVVETLEALSIGSTKDDLPVGLSRNELEIQSNIVSKIPRTGSSQAFYDFANRQVLRPGRSHTTECQPTPHTVGPALRLACKKIDDNLTLSSASKTVLKLHHGFLAYHPFAHSISKQEETCWVLRARQGVFKEEALLDGLIKHLVRLLERGLLLSNDLERILRRVQRETTKLE